MKIVRLNLPKRSGHLNRRLGMKTLHITKFVGTEEENSFSVPGQIVVAAARFLPAPALDALNNIGINLRDIATASRMGEAYSRRVEVREGGIDKTILLHLDD
jgi:hypothetical protein